MTLHASRQTFSFGTALVFLKNERRVAREGWNGKGMFLFLVPGSTFTVNRPPLLGIYPEGARVEYHAHIDMKTAQGYVVPWLASQADMLAEDWMEVFPELATQQYPGVDPTLMPPAAPPNSVSDEQYRYHKNDDKDS